MAIYSQINTGALMSGVRQDCLTLRQVLRNFQDRQDTFVAFADSDLELMGMLAADLSYLRAANADGSGAANMIFTGTDGRSLSPGYVYFNSMKQVIGP